VVFGREAPVTAGPGNWKAAAVARHGHFRATDADREHVITTLKAAFVQGRLTKDELDERVGRTLASRTYGELIPLTADIPDGLATAGRERKPARSRAAPQRSLAARAAACVALGIAPTVLVAAFVTDNDSLFKWLITVLIVYYLILMVAGALMLDSRQQGRSPDRICGRAAMLDARHRAHSGARVCGRADGSRRTANPLG
jgi:hypothetical protein